LNINWKYSKAETSIAADEDIEEELGMKLEKEHETEWSADIFKDLKIEKSKRSINPLPNGEWE